VFSYLYDRREDQDDPEMDGLELAQLAKGLLENHDWFIFRKMNAG